VYFMEFGSAPLIETDAPRPLFKFRKVFFHRSKRRGAETNP
jgi:hypothetical protein